VNVVKATLEALGALRLREDIYKLRGIPMPASRKAEVAV
jgi:ribosomal protein S5